MVDASSNEGKTTHTVQEDPECCEVFDQFLRFMYEGTIPVTGDNVFPLLKLSNMYGVQELRALCDDYLVNLHRDVSSATTVLRQAVGNKMQKTVEACLSVMRTNFELVTPEQLQTLDCDHVVALLDSPQNLVVSEEYAVFKKLTPWLTECSDEMLMKVLNCIRFVYMTAKQLSEVFASDIMSRALKSKSDFSVNVFAQHALYRESEFTELTHCTRPIQCPRLYLKQMPNIFQLKCADKLEGFCEATPDRLFGVSNVLKEFEIKVKDAQNIRLFKREDSEKWQIQLKMVSTSSADKDALWQIQVHLSHGNGHYRRGIERCTCKAEAAVQIRFGDDLSQFCAATSASHVLGETAIVFETTPIPSRPEKLSFRASVLVRLQDSNAQGQSRDKPTKERMRLNALRPRWPPGSMSKDDIRVMI